MDCVKVQETKKKVVVFCLRPPQNVKLGISRRSREVTAKKCAKKRDARAKLFLFVNINLFLFCRSRCRRLRRCVSSLMLKSEFESHW